jgi:hypothetical protein
VPASGAVVIVVQHIDALAVAHHLVGVLTLGLAIAIAIPTSLRAHIALAHEIPEAQHVIAGTPELAGDAVGIHADALDALEVAETQSIDALAPELSRRAAAIAVAVAGLAIAITRGIAIPVAGLAIAIARSISVAVPASGLARRGIAVAVVTTAGEGREREDTKAQDDGIRWMRDMALIFVHRRAGCKKRLQNTRTTTSLAFLLAPGVVGRPMELLQDALRAWLCSENADPDLLPGKGPNYSKC